MDALAGDAVITGSALKKSVTGKDAVIKVVETAGSLYASMRPASNEQVKNKEFMEYDAVLTGGHNLHGVVMLTKNAEAKRFRWRKVRSCGDLAIERNGQEIVEGSRTRRFPLITPARGNNFAPSQNSSQNKQQSALLSRKAFLQLQLRAKAEGVIVAATVFIAGCSIGLGAAIARLFAEEALDREQPAAAHLQR